METDLGLHTHSCSYQLCDLGDAAYLSEHLSSFARVTTSMNCA